MKRIFLLIYFVLFPVLLQAATASPPDIKTILDNLDRLYRSMTSIANIDMTIVTPNWQRTLNMDVWSQGMDQTFIYINAPKKDEGTTTLRIKQEMWNFFPNINKVMKVPPSMMMGSWMGSDFTNDDLVKETTFLNDYTGSLVRPKDAQEGCYYITLKPKARTVTVWDRIDITILKDGYIPVKEVYYDEKGKAMRTLVFSQIKEFSGRKIPAVMEMTPLNKPGNKTTIKYNALKLNPELPGDVFSLRNLQKKR